MLQLTLNREKVAEKSRLSFSSKTADDIKAKLEVEGAKVTLK